MYPKSDFKKEGRIGSFGYTFTGGQKNEEKIEPKNGNNFRTITGIIFVPASDFSHEPCSVKTHTHARLLGPGLVFFLLPSPEERTPGRPIHGASPGSMMPTLGDGRPLSRFDRSRSTFGSDTRVDSIAATHEARLYPGVAHSSE